MRAGLLRHRIVIQGVTETRDAVGGVSRSWATDATRWGSIEPVRGRELLESDSVRGDVTHKIRFRYYSGLTPTNRLTHGGRTFEIVSVLNPGERDIMTEVLAKEEV